MKMSHLLDILNVYGLVFSVEHKLRDFEKCPRDHAVEVNTHQNHLVSKII